MFPNLNKIGELECPGLGLNQGPLVLTEVGVSCRIGPSGQAVQDWAVEGAGGGCSGGGPRCAHVGHVGWVGAGVGAREAGTPVLLSAGQASARRPAATAVGCSFPGCGSGGGSRQGPSSSWEGEARGHGRRGVGGSLGSSLAPAGATLLGPGSSTRRAGPGAATRGGSRRSSTASALQVGQAQHRGWHPRSGHVDRRGRGTRAVHEGARSTRFIGTGRGAVVGGHGQALVHGPRALSFGALSLYLQVKEPTRARSRPKRQELECKCPELS